MLNISLVVVQIVAPVFILASIGFSWARLGYDYPIEFVTRMAMTFAVPCLLFTALQSTEIEPSALAALSIASLCAYAVFIAVSWLLIWLVGLDRASFVAPMAFGNTGNLGIPLALFAFGDLGLGYAIVIFAVMAVLGFSLGLWLVAGVSSPGRILREPVLGATCLGGVFLWQGWHTPVWLTNSLELIGQMAIPLMLITLGVAMARLKPGRVTLAIVLSMAKLALGLVIGVAIARAFALDPIASAVLILQLSTPVAVTSYLLAERYGVGADQVAGLVVTSTFFSVLALPAILSFLL